MTKAFTMIEIIFVIVIIGILSAVALPKLNATRKDAKISELLSNISTAATEIVAYAVTRGELRPSYSEMSNAILSMVNGEDAIQTGDTLNIKVNTISDCVQMKIRTIGSIKMLTVAYGNISGDSMCATLQKTVGGQKFPIPLLGSTIQH